ncbi:MAG: serine hydrolase [Oscillospiraceae bacterium]|nr:serine hydrolase [Oscillospiraceae bacterium]
MKMKKPDIFLAITMCLLVLAAVLCIVILFVQKDPETKPEPVNPQTSSTDSALPSDSGAVTPSGSEIVVPTDSKPAVELKAIDEAALKAALDESLKGLTSEWQVMVIDPALDTHVESAVNCKVDAWMTANRMTQVFIMGTVFKQAQDGTLKLEDVLADVKAMMTTNDTYAADRLTEQLGGGDAAKGREAVKTFAVDNGVKLGFNRPLTGNSTAKNYVSAAYCAELLNKLCKGELVSDAASRQMLELLLTPVENPEIALDLGADVKYGFVNDVEAGVCICSMGVVQLPNRSYVISVVCNEPVTTDGAKKKVADLVTLVKPYFAEETNP